MSERKVNPGIGMPQYLYLEQFGRVVRNVFGRPPFHVGSSLFGKEWRDVDVRLILPDDEFAQWCGPLTKPRCINEQWNGLCIAFAALGSHMTGLPIDFQIDQMSAANVEYPFPRSALGVVPGINGAIDHATGEKVTW